MVAAVRALLYVIPVPLWVQEHVPYQLAVALLATAASFIYERFVDRNGFDWSDIGQRSLGIALGLALWTYLPVPLIAVPLE